MENLWANFKSFFNAVKNWVQGDDWAFEWTGLLDGFKSTLEKLPEIAPRIKGPIEVMLEKDLDRLISEADLGGKVVRRHEELLKKFGLAEDPLAARKRGGVEAMPGLPEIKLPQLPGMGGAGEARARQKAAFVGLEEIQKKIQLAVLNAKGEQDRARREKQLLDETKKQTQLLEKQPTLIGQAIAASDPFGARAILE